MRSAVTVFDWGPGSAVSIFNRSLRGAVGVNGGSLRSTVGFSSRSVIVVSHGSSVGLDGWSAVGIDVSLRSVVVVDGGSVGARSRHNDGVISVLGDLALKSDLVVRRVGAGGPLLGDVDGGFVCHVNLVGPFFCHVDLRFFDNLESIMQNFFPVSPTKRANKLEHGTLIEVEGLVQLTSSLR